uniref:Canopy FGF signaling regulator 1 n=1 Tax=Lates calcarifer TaxID=8187 RepID=A0A4W6CVP8_LATCA
MASWIIHMTVLVLSLFISSGKGKRDKVLYCSACKAIVDELNYSISQVDPKKTINVGSFRLNPDGTMKDKKVPLVRSETYLSELLEGVCSSMSDYALHVDPDTQHKQYKRFAPRSSGATGDFPDFKNFQFDGPEASNTLKFACETIVEELEDDIISLFSQDLEHVHEELCNSVSGTTASSHILYQKYDAAAPVTFILPLPSPWRFVCPLTSS